MPEPRVGEVMARRVVTAVPATGFKELVQISAALDMGAVPIIGSTGKPVGIVTGRDLLTKLEYHGGTDYPPILPGSSRRRRWRKSSGLIAADLMTTPAATIAEATPVAAAAHLMATLHLCLLCVIDPQGYLIGVVTHQDLMRQYLRTDSAIQADAERDLTRNVRSPHWITVEVREAVVCLEGRLVMRSATIAAAHAAHHVPGVIAVRNNLRFDIDDHVMTGL